MSKYSPGKRVEVIKQRGLDLSVLPSMRRKSPAQSILLTVIFVALDGVVKIYSIYYATRMFVIKNSDVVNEIIKKIIYNDDSEMMTLKDIKNRLIDNIIELSINKIVETKIQFNGNTSHTTEYYVDDRRDEDDLNQKAIYMRIFRQSRDKQIRFERMSYSEYDYEGDVDTREYCKDIRSDDNLVFGTRANAVNFLLNKVIAELERRIKDFTYNVTRYENNITETMGKRNAWTSIDNTNNK